MADSLTGMGYSQDRDIQALQENVRLLQIQLDELRKSKPVPPSSDTRTRARLADSTRTRTATFRVRQTRSRRHRRENTSR